MIRRIFGHHEIRHGPIGGLFKQGCPKATCYSPDENLSEPLGAKNYTDVLRPAPQQVAVGQSMHRARSTQFIVHRVRVTYELGRSWIERECSHASGSVIHGLLLPLLGNTYAESEPVQQARLQTSSVFK